MSVLPESTLTVAQSAGNFKEIEGVLSSEAAMEEVQRCLGCGSKAFIKYLEDCQVCEACEHDCASKAIYVSQKNSLHSWCVGGEGGRADC